MRLLMERRHGSGMQQIRGQDLVGACSGRGYVNRENIRQQLGCVVVGTDVLTLTLMMLTVAYVRLDVHLLGNAAGGFVLIRILVL